MQLHNSDHRETLLPGLAATQRGARRLDFPKIFLSFEFIVPSEIADSYMKTNSRCEPRWLARSRSRNPSAAAQKSRRLRRPVRRTFARWRGRSDKVGRIGTVEVEHELETPPHRPPQAATLVHLQEGASNVIRPARCSRIGTESPDTSRPTRSAPKPPTIKMNLFRNTNL